MASNLSETLAWNRNLVRRAGYRGRYEEYERTSSWKDFNGDRSVKVDSWSEPPMLVVGSQRGITRRCLAMYAGMAKGAILMIRA